jgi:glycine cleavage system transcriptional repressor
MILWGLKGAYLRAVSEFAVTAIGRDRPGIVAAISRALFDLDGNIEDSQMSILRGHFAVMLIVQVPDSVGEETLAERLGGVRDQLGLEAITFNAVDELSAAPVPPATHVLTVYGADHPGIVAAVSSQLADLGVNITDLETRLTGAANAPLYTMMMELALGKAEPAEVDAALRRVAAQAEVDVSLRQLERDAL